MLSIAFLFSICTASALVNVLVRDILGSVMVTIASEVDVDGLSEWLR